MRLFNLFGSKEAAVAATITGTAVLDKQEYNAGDTMTLTVARHASDQQTVQETVTTVLTAADGSAQTITAGPVPVTSTVSVATTVAVSDDASRTWAQVSDDGSTAVFTATA